MAYLWRRAFSPLRSYADVMLSVLQQHQHSETVIQHICRRSMTALSTAEAIDKLVPLAEVTTFLRSAFDPKEGQSHRWLNNCSTSWLKSCEDRYNLVLHIPCGNLASSSELLVAFNKLKHLQLRYPGLNIFSMLSGGSCSQVTQSQLVHTIMRNYLTSPILLLEEDITKVIDGASFLVFHSSMDHFHQFKFDVETEEITKVLDQCDIGEATNRISYEEPKTDWPREIDAVKEPEVGCLKNILFNYPACVSVDEDGGRLFISDSNHHRVIISNFNGKILDCIGSSPGLEDGDFESAKFLRPAASYYCKDEDCLFIVDSENHAIRKANLEKRILQTFYPVTSERAAGGAWNWMLKKLGLAREVSCREPKRVISFPWHLMRRESDDLLISNRNFEKSWILKMPTGEIVDVLNGMDEASEACQGMISERMHLVKHVLENWHSKINRCFPTSDEMFHLSLISSVACLQGTIIFCNAVGQSVLKYCTETKDMMPIKFSNFGVLGLPYWLVCSLEKVWSRKYIAGFCEEHIRHVTVPPGKCEIRVSIDIPTGVELADNLHESSIWRQVRGSSSEMPESESVAPAEQGSGKSSFIQKYLSKGAAQRWYDDLETFYYEESVPESTDQASENLPDESYQDKRSVHFNCVVNTSPGASEVVVSAVLHLKIPEDLDCPEEQKAIVKRILECRSPVDHAGVDLFLESCTNVRGVIFMKPVHIRVKVMVADYPRGRVVNETPPSDSTVNINITLN